MRAPGLPADAGGHALCQALRQSRRGDDAGEGGCRKCRRQRPAQRLGRRRAGPRRLAGHQVVRRAAQGDQADSRFIPDHRHPLHRRPLIHRSPYTVDEEIVFRLVLQQQLPHSLPESRCVGVPR